MRTLRAQAEKRALLFPVKTMRVCLAIIMTGGIAGKIDGTATKFDQTTWKNDAAIKDSSNTGLILCTEDTPATVVGNYFGGIAGYAYQTLIYNSTSASGRTSGFTYN